MRGWAATLRVAAVLCLIGIVAPIVLTPLLGLTFGIGVGGLLVIAVAWFVQGLVVFAVPMLLVHRYVAQAPGMLAMAGVVVNLLIGLLLFGWASRRAAVAFSVPGLLLFSAAGALAGVYLSRQNRPGTR